MIRCATRRVLLALVACLLLLSAYLMPARAQESIRRDAPKDVVLAKMTVVQPPVIQIDGKPDRLSPGSRIRDTRNMLVLSASLAGQTLPIVYRRDAAGLVHEVWLLTPAEYEKLSVVSTGTPDGLQKFVNLLAAIFGART
jgi:hypothetical protein